MKNVITVLATFLCFISIAQEHYWVEFNSNNTTQYTDSLLKKGITIRNTSTWLHAVSIDTDKNSALALKAENYVKDVFPVLKFKTTQNASNSIQEVDSYWDYITPMNPTIFDSLGLNGKGVKVGIIDAGFTNANEKQNLDHIFEDGRVIGYKDFINPNRDNFYKAQTKGDFHGEKVFEYLAGYNFKDKQKIGLANGAQFYLARTENGDIEHLVEEDDWVKAIEWMHNNGVQLINTSLGYSEFDNPEENHEWSDMNGRTTMITKCAEKAVSEYGMIVVVSAGNSGAAKWQHITAPADARSVLTIGATTKEAKAKIYYSSTGMKFVSYIKPDVSTYSDRGTSYSSPAVCGFVACLMQYAPNLKAKEVIEIVKKSSHLYPYGNNFVGYGIPQAEIAISLINKSNDTLDYAMRPTLSAEDGKISFTIHQNMSKEDNVVLFHKSNSFIVSKQQVAKIKTNKKNNSKLKLIIPGYKKQAFLKRLFTPNSNSLHKENKKLNNNLKIKSKDGTTKIELRRRSFIDSYTTFQLGQYVYEIKW